MFWHTATSSLLKATTAKVITAAAAAVAVAGGAVYATTVNDSRETEKAAVAPNAPANRMAQPPIEAPASDDPGASDGATSGPPTGATTPPAPPPAAETTTKAAPRAATTTKKTTKAAPKTTTAPAQAPPAAQAPDTEAPSKPANLVGTNLGNNQFDSQVVLDWDPSTDNVGVAGYKVYALTSNHGWKLVGDVHDGSTDDTVTSSEAWASEDFRVTAYDAAGNESDPAQVHVEVPFAV